jgi:hypothetical protein
MTGDVRIRTFLFNAKKGLRLTTQPPTYDPARAARTGRVVGGSVLAVIGAVVALGGGAVLALGGSNGTFESGHRDVSTKTAALVSEPAKINDTQSVTDVLGHPSVRISADSVRADRNLFVGVGPKAQVDHYLAGAPIDTVHDFSVDPWNIDKSARAGTARPKPPASQSFWVAKSAGSTAAIDWKVRDGNWRVVVMNADGSRGVATMSEFAVKIPHLATLALIALIAGIVTLIGGIALIAIPSRRRRDAGQASERRYSQYSEAHSTPAPTA